MKATTRQLVLAAILMALGAYALEWILGMWLPEFNSTVPKLLATISAMAVIGIAFFVAVWLERRGLRNTDNKDQDGQIRLLLADGSPYEPANLVITTNDYDAARLIWRKRGNRIMWVMILLVNPVVAVLSTFVNSSIMAWWFLALVAGAAVYIVTSECIGSSKRRAAIAKRFTDDAHSFIVEWIDWQVMRDQHARETWKRRRARCTRFLNWVLRR